MRGMPEKHFPKSSLKWEKTSLPRRQWSIFVPSVQRPFMSMSYSEVRGFSVDCTDYFHVSFLPLLKDMGISSSGGATKQSAETQGGPLKYSNIKTTKDPHKITNWHSSTRILLISLQHRTHNLRLKVELNQRGWSTTHRAADSTARAREKEKWSVWEYNLHKEYLQ